jgi:hypothetical protein
LIALAHRGADFGLEGQLTPTVADHVTDAAAPIKLEDAIRDFVNLGNGYIFDDVPDDYVVFDVQALPARVWRIEHGILSGRALHSAASAVLYFCAQGLRDGSVDDPQRIGRAGMARSSPVLPLQIGCAAPDQRATNTPRESGAPAASPVDGGKRDCGNSAR